MLLMEIDFCKPGANQGLVLNFNLYFLIFLKRAYPTWINFHLDLILQMLILKFFLVDLILQINTFERFCMDLISQRRNL